MNKWTLKRAANELETLSDQSDNEVADLEDEVIHLIEAGADLVPLPSFVGLCKCGLHLAQTVSKSSYTTRH